MTTQTTTQILNLVADYAAGVRTDDNGSLFNIHFVEGVDLEEKYECYNTSVCSGGRNERVYIESPVRPVKRIWASSNNPLLARRECSVE